ncbi:hypothetical protein BN874_840043 [Candidatus Contendobacter odensis Run_B_J11]|uniref:Uncharacterized protein n=1 Tax=Candidatus Contendobacter odensis Run_B_J11 TaxID=1400861 RepID=A0A7U7GFS0_9GAMM|nr:hypothetical protein BN874_840043 [Candidatus Contendobacter odensis Run_B_J11]
MNRGLERAGGGLSEHNPLANDSIRKQPPQELCRSALAFTKLILMYTVGVATIAAD